MATYDLFIDPSHAWLKVNKERVEKYGITPTPFSYEMGDFYYLEEDCDMTAFLHAAKAAGENVNMRERVSDRSSRIRNYQRVGA